MQFGISYPTYIRAWHDVEMAEEFAAIRQVSNGTFYRRTRAWVDSNVADASRIDETVTRWSPRFFELLKSTNAEENGRLSQTGELILLVQGRVLRVVES